MVRSKRKERPTEDWKAKQNFCVYNFRFEQIPHPVHVYKYLGPAVRQCVCVCVCVSSPPTPCYLLLLFVKRRETSQTSPDQKWQPTGPGRLSKFTHQIWSCLRITALMSRRDTPVSPWSTTGKSCRSGWTWRNGSTRAWTGSTRVRWVSVEEEAARRQTASTGLLINTVYSVA